MQKRVMGYLSWQGLSVFTQAVAQIGVMAVLARFLDPEDFGLVAAANILVTFVQMIAEGGLGSAVVQRPQVSPAFIGAAMSVAMLISAACYVLLLAVSLPFEAMLGMDDVGPVILVLGLSALLAGPSGVLEGLLQRNLRFDSLFKVSLASSIFGYAIPAIGSAMAGAGVWSLVIGTLGRLGTKVLMMALMQLGSWRLNWDRASARDLLHFGFGLTQDRFWSWLSAQAAPLFVGILFGQALLGQFYMGSQLAVLPAQHISTVVAGVFFPIMSRSVADPELASRQFLAVTTTIFVLLSALGLFLAINADLVVHLVFGPGWQQAIVIFQVLCLGAGIRSTIQVCDSLNIARADVFALASRRALSAVILIVTLFLAQSLGVVAAALALLVSQAAMLAMTAGLAVRGLRITLGLAGPYLRRVAVALALLALADLPFAGLQAGGWLSGIPLLGISIAANLLVMTWVVKAFAVPLGLKLPWAGPGRAREG